MQPQHATTTTTDHSDMTNTARCSNHCNMREGPPLNLQTYIALTHVAVIAASCCVGHICMVGGGGCANAGPDLCALDPDLWTLSLWCFPSFNWCICTGDGYHQLQLALVVLFHSVTSAGSPLAHMVVSPSASYAGGNFSSSHRCKYCTCTTATCFDKSGKCLSEMTA